MTPITCLRLTRLLRDQAARSKTLAPSEEKCLRPTPTSPLPTNNPPAQALPHPRPTRPRPQRAVERIATIGALSTILTHIVSMRSAGASLVLSSIPKTRRGPAENQRWKRARPGAPSGTQMHSAMGTATAGASRATVPTQPGPSPVPLQRCKRASHGAQPPIPTPSAIPREHASANQGLLRTLRARLHVLQRNAPCTVRTSPTLSVWRKSVSVRKATNPVTTDQNV